MEWWTAVLDGQWALKKDAYLISLEDGNLFNLTAVKVNT
jgi:hypothetical protein